MPAGGGGDSLYAADVLIDLPFPQIQASGGSENEAVEMAEFSMMCINTSYLRDAAILNRVGLIILRMDADLDPYQGQTTTGQMLTQVRTENSDFVNNASSTRGNHDLGLTASTQVGGGLAGVGVVATSSGFSSNGSDANGDFSVVGRHELGHNWGSNHFEGGGTPEGNTIMSGNSLGKFSSGELFRILAQRQTRLSSLDDLGNTAPPLPPRASNDVIVTEVASPPVNVSPLANDSDTNGGVLSITSFDATQQIRLYRHRGRMTNSPSPSLPTFRSPPIASPTPSATKRTKPAQPIFSSKPTSTEKPSVTGPSIRKPPSRWTLHPT